MIAPAAALALVWLVATTVGPTSDTTIHDLGLYRWYASALADGLVPYRDFAFEYPPAALAPMWAGAWAGFREAPYAWGFGALMLGALLAAQYAAAALAGERARAVAWSFVLIPVLAGAMARTHFDLVPAALVVVALALLARGTWPPLAFALLGLGTAMKVFPAVVALVALAWLVGAGRPRDALHGAGAFAAVLAVTCVPFAAVAPNGFGDMIAFHVDRPVQVESTAATVLWTVGGSDVTTGPGGTDRFKSNGLVGGAAGPVAVLFGLLLVAALALTLHRVASAKGDRRALVLGAFAGLLAFVTCNKVLSPQYVLWLAPLAPVAWVYGARAPAALVAVAIVLTQIEFPRHYFDLVAGEPALIALVAARNALLLGALSLLLAPLAAVARSHPRAAAASTG